VLAISDLSTNDIDFTDHRGHTTWLCICQLLNVLNRFDKAEISICKKNCFQTQDSSLGVDVNVTGEDGDMLHARSRQFSALTCTRAPYRAWERSVGMNGNQWRHSSLDYICTGDVVTQYVAYASDALRDEIHRIPYLYMYPLPLGLALT
jgi:hypothetical protein